MATRPAAGRKMVEIVSLCLGLTARVAGALAAGIMLVLAASILLGIILRTANLGNAWTYDLDTFCLVWLAFLGAAFTGYRGAHVTSGVSLEHFFGRHVAVLVALRFIVVAGFLSLFIFSGYQQCYSSLSFHETTLDVAQWPVWMAKLSLPVGGVAWLSAECYKLLAGLFGEHATSDPR